MAWQLAKMLRACKNGTVTGSAVKSVLYYSTSTFKVVVSVGRPCVVGVVTATCSSTVGLVSELTTSNNC